MATKDEIRKKIKQGREALQMSQREFAEKIGVSVSLLSFWESGYKDIKPRHEPYLRNMAQYFKCDWRSLLPDPPKLPVFDEPKEQKQEVIQSDKTEIQESEFQKYEEMNDPAMLTPLAKLLKAKVYVEVIQKQAVTGEVVKIRNKLTGDTAFRYLSNELGCKLLKPIDKDYEVFPYEENGKFEILGVVNSVVVKKP